MVAPASTPTQQPQASAQHQYGTRIRSNSGIKPSIRLRHSASSVAPTPRRIKPAPTAKAKHPSVTPDAPLPEYPHFPPDHVMLHHDDANSKVFMAIGRSFMSVNNRAMTIKDLAEMTMKYGIMCQNVSAAGQAITTYIRAHLQRCEVQQDHPLLLRHVLSGTASDDDLLPALHSRTGGAHCALNPSENRVTNFRRGTMVWYLSRAAGAPCPFARCGIRLCEYNEQGKASGLLANSREKKREKDRLRHAEQCGQKRKRLLRSAYADKGSNSDSMSEEEKPPPKVKLTLRLRPLKVSSSGASLSASPAPQDAAAPVEQSHTYSSPEIIDLSKVDSESSDSEEDSEDDSMSVDSSVSSDADEESPVAGQSGDSLSPFPCGVRPTFSASPDDYRRSTSASPPPDSDDEDEDASYYQEDMTTFRRYSFDRYSSWDDEDDDEMDLDKFWDVDNDADTQWESPGPRSPSAQFESGIVVKQEPNDVGGLLDIWDDLDPKADPKVVDVVLRAAAGLDSEYVQPKLEVLDPWELPYFASTSSDSFAAYPIDDPTSHIKEEELEGSVSFLTRGLLTPPPEYPLRPPSPISPIASSESPSTSLVTERRDSHLIWRDAELLGPDSLKPHDLAEGEWGDGCKSTSVASPTAEQAEAVDLASTGASVDATSQARQARVGMPPPRLDLAAPGRREQGYLVPDLSSPSLLSSLTSLSIHTPTSPDAPKAGSPLSATEGSPAGLPTSRSLLHPNQDGEPRTIHPCQPCDPNIVATQMEGVSVYQMTLGSSLILRRVDTDFVHVDPLLKELGLPTTSSSPSNAICITEGSSQVRGTWVPLSAARELCKNHPTVAVFLSDQLPDRFPSALVELTRHVHPFSRWHNPFGQQFKSTLDAKRHSPSTQLLDFAADEHDLSPMEREEHFLSLQQSAFALTHAILPTPASSTEEHLVPELPLSPAEEKMFRELCTDPEWESPTPPPPESAALEHGDAPVEAPPTGPSASAKGKERPRQERPLRRSKRVANAIANRSRTRSSKRGSRSSLS